MEKYREREKRGWGEMDRDTERPLLFFSTPPLAKFQRGPWGLRLPGLSWSGWVEPARGRCSLTVEAWVCVFQVRGVDIKQMLLDHANLQDQEDSRYGEAQSRPNDGVLDVCRAGGS